MPASFLELSPGTLTTHALSATETFLTCCGPAAHQWTTKVIFEQSDILQDVVSMCAGCHVGAARVHSPSSRRAHSQGRHCMVSCPWRQSRRAGTYELKTQLLQPECRFVAAEYVQCPPLTGQRHQRIRAMSIAPHPALFCSSAACHHAHGCRGSCCKPSSYARPHVNPGTGQCTRCALKETFSSTMPKLVGRWASV